jgi:hypothetical protein
MNAYQKIKQSQEHRDNCILNCIKEHGMYELSPFSTTKTMNAVKRLEKKGLIEYNKELHSYVLKNNS